MNLYTHIKISFTWFVMVFALASPALAQVKPEYISADFSGLTISVEKIRILKHREAIVSVVKKYTDAGKSAHVEGIIRIDATPEQIWAVLIDCARGPTFLPGLKKCELLKASPDKKWDIRRHTNKISAMIPKTISEFKNEYDYPNSIAFSRTGGDLKALSGIWQLHTNADRTQTILSYRSDITVKSALPDSILRKSIRKRMTKVLKLICVEVENDIALLTDIK